MDQKLLNNQESDQDFSENEDQKEQEVFEEGSDDDVNNLIQVTNPILFTEHVPVMGRVPLSKSSLYLSMLD